MTVKTKPVASLLGALTLVALSGVNGFAAGNDVPLGQTLSGQTCWLTPPLVIVCSDDSEPVGSLHISQLENTLPNDGSERKSVITAATKKTVGGLGTSLDLTCDDGRWLQPKGGSSILFFCTLRSNNWPRIVLVTASANALFIAEGLPDTLPVLEAAIKRKIAASNDQETKTALKLVQAKYGAASLTRHAGTFTAYNKLVESARHYAGADNYAGAEDAYRQALEIETTIFGADSAAVGETVAELALQVSNQGRFDEAAALFRRASPIIEALSNATGRARFVSYEALDAANQRKFVDALKFARQATELRRREIDVTKSTAADSNGAAPTAPANLEGELAHSLRIEAEMALRLGDNGTAQVAAEEALWIITEVPGLPIWWRPEMIALMGEVNAAQGRVVTAERDFLDSLAMNQKLFGDTAPTARAQLRLGKFYSDQQVYAASVSTYRAAFEILAKDSVARSQIVADQIIPFLVAARALEKQNSSQSTTLDADVFRAVQFINSGVADKVIARVAAREVATNRALSGLIEQYQRAQTARDDARIDLVAENAKSSDERKSDRVQAFETALKTATAEADTLKSKVQQDFPEYAKLEDPGPADLAAVRAHLSDGEAFLKFVVGVKSSFALLVTRNGLVLRRLDANALSLSSDIAALRGAFVPKLGRAGEFSLQTSFALYQQLLAPLEPSLVGITHLTVVPDGDLASLPLSLLVTSAPLDGYVNAAWLVRRMAISQVPSPRAFIELGGEPRTRIAASHPFFGVGNPAFAGVAANNKALGALAAACQRNGPVDPALLRALRPLPETVSEVQSVGRLMDAQPGSILLGAGANEEAVRNANLGQYKVLYFATHAVLPGEFHCEAQPGLVLSPPTDHASRTKSDGLLTASEIAELKLNADLVVLSACNTAASGGTAMGGGALEGLADSFFAAGARAVLASHWEVPSSATQKLMIGVFDRYAKDRERDLAEALRQSQLALIAQPATAHPFYWAAFTLIGDSKVEMQASGSAAANISFETGE